MVLVYLGLVDTGLLLVHYQSQLMWSLVCLAPSPIRNAVAFPNQMSEDGLQIEQGPVLALLALTLGYPCCEVLFRQRIAPDIRIEDQKSVKVMGLHLFL